MGHNRQKKLFQIYRRFYHLLSSKYWHGHGVHSPAVYELLSKVVFDRTKFEQYRTVQRIRGAYSKNNSMLQIKEIGAGSKVFKNNERKVSKIAKYSAVPKKYGRLLFRLVKYYKPVYVLEIGTSLGISTAYMALGNSTSQIVSIEGNNSLIDIARKTHLYYGVKNVEYIHGNFNEMLPELLLKKKIDMAFVDGNHRYEATLNYFHWIKKNSSCRIIVFDDINWSPEMHKAWKEISNEVNVAVDLFQFGIVFLSDSITKGYYKVRF
jgi:predicted O-methyltransferase YrrM